MSESGNKLSKSWRTTIPVAIVREFNIKTGYELEWFIVRDKTRGDHLGVYVIPKQFIDQERKIKNQSDDEFILSSIEVQMPLLKKLAAKSKNKRVKEYINFLEKFESSKE